MGNMPTSIYSAKDKTWEASGAHTATGTSNVKGVDRYSACKILLDVTAVSGTSPTLNLYFQCLLPDEVNWMDIASFAQMTGTGRRCLDFISGGSSLNTPTDGTLTASTILAVIFGRWVRMKWVIAGTNPNFTFSISVIFWE